MPANVENKKLMASPAGFAALHDYRWNPAPHLQFISREIVQLIWRARAGDEPSILAIETPPRHGKSELVSKWLPAWYLSLWPERNVMLASYEANFARTWGRKARSVVHELSDDTGQGSDWRTKDGGGMVTAGVGGALTGRGASLLVIDDPIKNAEESQSSTIRDKHWDWWQSTASTRIEPGGCAIVMMTRWNRDDLIGRMLRENNLDGRQIKRITLPAIAKRNDPLGRVEGEPLWPSRWPVDALDRIRNSISPQWWEAMYQQNPRAFGQAEFPDEWFTNAWFERWPDNHCVKTMALDPSKGKSDKTGDFQAYVKLLIGQDDILYVQAHLDRQPINQMVADGVAIFKEFRPMAFGLESNAWQDLLAPMFKTEFQSQGVLAPDVWEINNSVNKNVRIRRLAGYLANGRMKFMLNCPHTRLLVDQLLDFPNGDFDDAADSLEMAVRLAEQLVA